MRDRERQIEIERRRRQLRIQGPAENVLLHWLTGEVLVEKPPQEMRRRQYQKNSRKRQEHRKPAHIS